MLSSVHAAGPRIGNGSLAWMSDGLADPAADCRQSLSLEPSCQVCSLCFLHASKQQKTTERKVEMKGRKDYVFTDNATNSVFTSRSGSLFVVIAFIFFLSRGLVVVVASIFFVLWSLFLW